MQVCERGAFRFRAVQGRTLVFLGRPTKQLYVTQYPNGSGPRRYGRVYPVIVLRTWKDPFSENQIRQPSEVMTFDDCPVKLTVDKEYVFFADRSGTLHKCYPPVAASDRSAPVRQLDEEVQRLLSPDRSKEP